MVEIVSIGKVRDNEVYIIDDGGNGVIDEVDSIQIGTMPYRLDNPVAKEALKKLGVTDLKVGIKIKPLKEYVDTMAKAQPEITKDFTYYDVVTKLKQLREYAKAAGIPVDKTWDQEAIKTIKNAVENRIQYADKDASRGQLHSEKGHSSVYSACEVAKDVGILCEEKRIQDVLKKAVEGKLKKAKELASQGGGRWRIKEQIDLARMAAEDGNIPFNKKYEKLAQEAQEMAGDHNLDTRSFIESGLSQNYDYNRDYLRSVPFKRRKNRVLAYADGSANKKLLESEVDTYLKRAEESARQGESKQQIESYIRLARMSAQKAEIPFEEEYENRAQDAINPDRWMKVKWEMGRIAEYLDIKF